MTEVHFEGAPAGGRHATMTGLGIAFGDGCGTFLVVGVPPPDVLLGIGAAASGVGVFASTRAAREARRLLEPITPAWVLPIGVDGKGLPEVEQSYDNAVVWELPKREPLAALERALINVADDGLLFVSVPRQGGIDQRIERLVRSLAADRVTVPSHAPRDRLVLAGRRKAPFPSEAATEAPGLLPVSVVIAAWGWDAALEALLVDVFLRQNLPPSEVFVLDRGGPATPPVPEDLHGIPAASAARAILVPCRGAARADAINDALGGVAFPLAAIFEPPLRLAPNHLAGLGMLLEAPASRIAVVGRGAVLGPDGVPATPLDDAAPDPRQPVRSLLAAGGPVLGRSLFRVAGLRAAGGIDPALARAADDDLWIRLAARGEIARSPLPVAAVPAEEAATAPRGPRRWPADEAVRVLDGLARDLPASRLADEFPERPRREREAMALLARGAALLRSGATAAAAREVEAARALAPELGEAGLLFGRVLLAQGRFEEARTLATAARARDPMDPRPAMLAARAALRSGDTRGADAVFAAYLASDPACEAVHLARIRAALAGGSAPAARDALDAYLATRRDLLEGPLGDDLAP